MKFTDISQALLSLQNCSVIVSNDIGDTYYSNLHKTVREWTRTVLKNKNPAKDEQCMIIKERLKHILDNYHTLKRGSVGFKNGQKAS
jgi:hypothetical protein